MINNRNTAFEKVPECIYPIYNDKPPLRGLIFSTFKIYIINMTSNQLKYFKMSERMF
jgi:hypothetical protein